ncbi:MAG: thymidine phosphorylase [Nitrospiraceae bacterium]|nr:thymidine phosphorylase [Nitrospiraceae bacterium]
MRAVDLIRKKRDGAALAGEEISFLVDNYLKGAVPDYQMSAFLMAVYNRGMTGEETARLTDALAAGGGKLRLDGVQGVMIDKQSTGGVGDKTSIILAPLMAAMGLKMPSITGRGLGHTGGTIDKLASIPGLRTETTMARMADEIKSVGFSICGQTDEIAPADGKLCALRDATATAGSPSLIAASIMSKKISAGLDALVLDVKAGSGGFVRGLDEARDLARLMVGIGSGAGIKTVALITDMDAPFGRAVGNALEMKECISALKGRFAPDLLDLTMTLAAWMLHLADTVSEEAPPQRIGEHLLKRYRDESWDYIEHGDAFKKFVEFIDARQGDPEAAFDAGRLPKAGHIKPVLSPWNGYIKRMDAFAVGHAAMLLGAGRARLGDETDPAAGIIIGKKPGDTVHAQEPFATLYTNDPQTLAEAEEALLSGVEISDREPPRRRLVLDVILPG